MADTIDVQNANEWLAEVQSAARELVNVLKGGIDVGVSGELGDLALINTLADAQVGDAQVLRKAIGSLAPGDYGGAGGLAAPVISGSINSTSIANGSYMAYLNDGLPSGWGGGTLTVINRTKNVNVIQIIHDYLVDRTAWRRFRNDTWQPWVDYLSTANTTTDSNGFLKAASPIFRLANVAADAGGEGFTLDGCGAYNSEAKGVTASHDETGVYTVSGSLGFADDGWTIEIPQDVNGNRLCFVETETADDGTITVRTFGRRFDYETAMIVAGDPIDIPDGRWIDLRLSMPQPEQPAEPDDSAEQEPAQ